MGMMLEARFLACVMNMYIVGDASIGEKIIYTNPHDMGEC